MFRHIITEMADSINHSDIADGLNTGQCGHTNHPDGCDCNTADGEWGTLEDFADQMA